MSLMQLMVALASAAVAIIGGITALRKFGPESTSIYVDSAEVSVRMADKQRDDALARLDSIEARMSTLEQRLEHEREQRRLSNGYARVLAQVLRDHAMPVPQPPPGLDLD